MNLLLIYFEIIYLLHSSEYFFLQKVCILNKHFRKTIPRVIFIQITYQSIDFKRRGESTCIDVSRDCLYK